MKSNKNVKVQIHLENTKPLKDGEDQDGKFQNVVLIFDHYELVISRAMFSLMIAKPFKEGAGGSSPAIVTGELIEYDP